MAIYALHQIGYNNKINDPNNSMIEKKNKFITHGPNEAIRYATTQKLCLN